jgi:CysZ protein
MSPIMIEAVALALRDILSPPFRGVLYKSLALTIGLLVALWVLIERLVSVWVETPWTWLDITLNIVTGVGLIVGLGFLVAPVAALFAGLFLDDIAELVESEHYPADPIGRPLPLARALWTSVKFLAVVLLVNALALPLVLILGFGVLIFLAANAYLLGREYFELVALRHNDEVTARRLRMRHSGRIFVAGLVIAGFVAIPIVNLLAPLFATAFMVHVYKGIAAIPTARASVSPPVR